MKKKKTYKLINKSYTIRPEDDIVELGNKKDDDYYQRQWRYVIKIHPKDWVKIEQP